VEVYADVRYHADTGIDATAAFQIRFAQGTVAQCLVTDEADSWFYDLQIIGAAGKIHLSFSEFPRYTVTVRSQALREYAEPKTFTSALGREAAILEKMKAELSEFAAAVAEGREPAIPLSAGHNVLAVTDAVLESGRTGRPMTLAGHAG
jgi:predicted dehydrogenase